MVALNFNAQQVAPNAALEPIPSGTYDVSITASSEKPTKDGKGAYIELEMTVTGGQFHGRKVFDRLNIKNASAQAVEIAYGTLSAICHVTGRYQIQDTGQLHGVPFKVVVAKVARQDRDGEYSNEVKGYKDVQGNDPGKSGQQTQPQGQQPPNGFSQQPQGGQGGQPQWVGAGQQGGVQQGGQPSQAPQWAAQQPSQPPHTGPGGQQYPDAAHQPQGQTQQPPQQPPQQNSGQPQWANGGQQPSQGQANPAQPQGQQPSNGGFSPGSAPPWAGGQPQV